MTLELKNSWHASSRASKFSPILFYPWKHWQLNAKILNPQKLSIGITISSTGINGGLTNSQKFPPTLIHNYFPHRTHQNLLSSNQHKIFCVNGMLGLFICQQRSAWTSYLDPMGCLSIHLWNWRMKSR